MNLNLQENIKYSKLLTYEIHGNENDDDGNGTLIIDNN